MAVFLRLFVLSIITIVNYFNVLIICNFFPVLHLFTAALDSRGTDCKFYFKKKFEKIYLMMKIFKSLLLLGIDCYFSWKYLNSNVYNENIVPIYFRHC